MKDKNFYQKIKAIGWFQLIGGIVGLVFMVQLITRLATINGSAFLIVLTGLGLFSFSVYAGSLMIKKGNEKRAIILSIVNQSLQIFQFKILGFGLTYSTLLSFTIGYKPPEIEFHFDAFMLFSGTILNGDEFFIFINIIPVLICGVLLSLLDHVKSDIPEIDALEEVKSMNENLTK